MGVLWLAPLTAVVSLWSIYDSVGGMNNSGWLGVALFSVVVAAIATVSVLTTSRRLPGIQWQYGFWVGVTWWLAGLGVLFNVHRRSPESEPAWLWIAVLASMMIAIVLSYAFRRRDLRPPSPSRGREVWQGSTAINQFVLLFIPLVIIVILASVDDRDVAALSFVLPVVVSLAASVRSRVTIFDDQLQVQNWLGIVLFRIPLSSVWTAAAVPPITRYRDPRPLFLGPALGWAMFGSEAVLRVTLWPHDVLRMQLAGGESIEIGVKNSGEAATAVRSLLGLAPLTPAGLPPSDAAQSPPHAPPSSSSSGRA